MSTSILEKRPVASSKHKSTWQQDGDRLFIRCVRCFKICDVSSYGIEHIATKEKIYGYGGHCVMCGCGACFHFALKGWKKISPETRALIKRFRSIPELDFVICYKRGVFWVMRSDGIYIIVDKSSRGFIVRAFGPMGALVPPVQENTLDTLDEAIDLTIRQLSRTATS